MEKLYLCVWKYTLFDKSVKKRGIINETFLVLQNRFRG